MAVTVKRLKDKYRVVDANTGRIVKSVNGKPVDGGGHSFEAKCARQCEHVNCHCEGKK